MTETTTYRYTLENAAKACTEISAEELAALELTTEFQGAMDLPGNVEFARAETASGERVTVYRQPAE